MIPPKGQPSGGAGRGVIFGKDEQPIVVGVTVRITKGGCENRGVVSFYSTPWDFRDIIGEAVEGDFSRWKEARPSWFGDRESMRFLLEKMDEEDKLMGRA